MGALSSLLRNVQDGGLMFWCPGCGCAHMIKTGDGNGPRWNWNGDAERPTFSPSILVTYQANPDADEDHKEWRSERRCHSYVTDGRIQFLSDSTHALAGKTVDMVDWEQM